MSTSYVTKLFYGIYDHTEEQYINTLIERLYDAQSDVSTDFASEEEMKDIQDILESYDLSVGKYGIGAKYFLAIGGSKVSGYSATCQAINLTILRQGLEHQEAWDQRIMDALYALGWTLEEAKSVHDPQWNLTGNISY